LDRNELLDKPFHYNKEALKIQCRPKIYGSGSSEGIGWGAAERRGRLSVGSKARKERWESSIAGLGMSGSTLLS
jgi:hypothetical protein